MANIRASTVSTAGVFLLAATAVVTGFSCARSTTTPAPPATSPETQQPASQAPSTSQPPTAPGDHAAPESSQPAKQASDGKPILWIEQTAGYVDMKRAELYRRHPYLFALYADGRLEYRDDSFHCFAAQLSPNEVERLFQKVESAGFFDIESVFGKDNEGMVIMDAGSECIGARWQGREHELEISGPVSHWLQVKPDSKGLAVYAQVRTLLTGTRPANSQPVSDAEAPPGGSPR